MSRAEDLGHYFRVPCDNRDLNYDKYPGKWAKKKSPQSKSYHSHNTHRLNVEEMKQLLLKVDIVREDFSL